MKRAGKKINGNKVLTSNQADFLLEFARSDLKDAFRFTGGTALSAFFLEHRLSEDLDFFSTEKISIHICQRFLSRLLQIPGGIDSLPLLVHIEPNDVRDFFERSVRDMVRKEISHVRFDGKKMA